MLKLHKRPSAKRDLIAHYVYLTEQAGIETADRFLLSVEQSFADLLRRPGIGMVLALRRRELSGLRKWRVSGFEKFLIFYVRRAGYLSVVRVMHATQDWWDLLGMK